MPARVTALLACVCAVAVGGHAHVRVVQPEGRLRPPGSAPIERRVNWFVDGFSGKASTIDFLLHKHKDIADGVYTCCGGLSFKNASDGTMTVDLGTLNFTRDIKVGLEVVHLPGPYADPMLTLC